MKYIGMIFFFYLLIFPGQAVPESKLSKIFTSRIIPYWNTRGVHKSFRSVKDATLFGHFFNQDPKDPLVVIIPGRTEPAENYAEVVYDLRNTNFSVYVMDVRGQGHSSRVAHDHDVGHVNDTHDYVDDLKVFFDRYVPSPSQRKVFLFAHSMGANMATRFLAQNPNRVTAFAMTSPMYRINTGNIPRGAARGLAFFETIFGNGEGYAVGQKPWSESDEIFTKNRSTQSSARFNMYRSLFLNNKELRVGGPSYGWVREAFRSEAIINGIAKKSFTVPTLLLSAGKDQLVFLKDQREFCQNKATRCKELHFADAYHHILYEKDSIRERAIREITNFFASY